MRAWQKKKLIKNKHFALEPCIMNEFGTLRWNQVEEEVGEVGICVKRKPPLQARWFLVDGGLINTTCERNRSREQFAERC
jgi:hypothetical protein